MNMKNIFCCLLPGLLFGACANKVYEETGDSVIVKVQQEVTGGPRLVRLQVMGDKLIRVSATADSKFADPQSLIVVPQEKQISFAVMQNGDTITVSTKEVKASVLASTGEVWFADKDGKLIPDCSIPLEIKSTGKGSVIAAGNGSADDMKSFRSLKPKTFRGKAIAIVQPNAEKGTITLTVSAKGLPEAAIVIETY